MTLREALLRTIERLKGARIPEARLDAEYLVAEAAGIPRLRLPLQSNAGLSVESERQLDQWVQERVERRPLAYVLGQQPFMHLTFRVTPSVLIPRPETELLVEKASFVLDQLTAAVVADVGTGSGNIALSLAQHPNVAELHAIDISKPALEVARENALRNHAMNLIHWHQGDLLGPLMDRKGAVDLIVANLPYVTSTEMAGLSPEVRWEPSLALDGGRDGLAYISELIEQAESVLKSEGILLLEIGSSQGPRVLEILRSRTRWKNYDITRDLAGHQRIVHATKGALVGSFNY